MTKARKLTGSRDLRLAIRNSPTADAYADAVGYRNAGIETSSHAGRALFICSLADKGVSIRIIQKAVGHRSLAATNAYLDARPQEVRIAVELLK